MLSTVKLGESVLLQGPSGAGKSTTIRHALRHEGSGVVVCAPGSDEMPSYDEFFDRDGYRVLGFDDPQFMPAIGLTHADGLKQAVATLNELYKLENETRKYALIGVDTVDGFAQLGINFVMSRRGYTSLPEGKDSPTFWIDVRNVMEQFFRPIRALRGLGLHVIATTHVAEKEIKKTAMAEAVAKVGHVPLISGAFRDVLPGYFDLVAHVEIRQSGMTRGDYNEPANPRHIVRWLPDPKRPTKSRLGPLAKVDYLPNEWSVIKAALQDAKQRRLDMATATS